MFMQLGNHKVRPETQRYQKWCKQKKEEEFRFQEVLPFGGIVNKKGRMGRYSKEQPQKNRSEPVGHLMFNPDPAWKKLKSVMNNIYLTFFLNTGKK